MHFAVKMHFAIKFTLSWTGILTLFLLLKTNALSILHRYLHYYNRYMNHMQSLKFENKLYNGIKEKMEEMQQHNMSWIEVSSTDKSWIQIPLIIEFYWKCLISISNIPGSIFEACRRHTVSVSADTNVYLCIRLLSTEKQSITHIWGESKRSGNGHRNIIRIFGARYYIGKLGRYQTKSSGQIQVIYCISI